LRELHIQEFRNGTAVEDWVKSETLGIEGIRRSGSIREAKITVTRLVPAAA
jgi:hypothetical protein